MSILAEFLLLGIEGRGGGYALSQDKTDFFLLAIQAVAKNIAETINKHVIQELVDYNFVVDDYPQLQVGRLADIDRTGLANVLSSLQTGGFVNPDPNIEVYLRKMLGLPEISNTKEEV